MIIPTPTGLRGTPSLGLTPVFKCNLTKCYSTDGMGIGNGTDGLFRRLQSTINRFASVVGFKKIPVDGFITTRTVGAYYAAVSWGAQSTAVYGPVPVTVIASSIIGYGTNRQTLASMAQGAYEGLRKIGDAAKLPPMEFILQGYTPGTSASPTGPTSPVTPAPYDPGATVTTTFPDDGIPAPTGVFSTNWPWYVAGGIILAGLSTATVLVWKKPKRRK